jgi:hypothetical protein
MIIEKELLVVVHDINKFRHYIIGYKYFVHIDHSTIKFLMNKPVTNPRVTIWLLLLQEFNINIIDRPGKDNLVADFLSRHYYIWVKFRRRVRRNCHFLLSKDRQTSDPLKRRFT